MSKKIFNNLDTQNLTKCNEVSQLWKQGIEERKYFWVRKIQKVGEDIPDFNVSDEKVC